MKKYLIIITIAFICIFNGLTSCSSFLELKPEGSVSLDSYWKSEADVETSVLSCYKSMQEADFLQRLIIWGDFRSDELSIDPLKYADEDIRNIYNANILPKNSYSQWGSFYKVINYCNTLLHFAPGVVDPNFTTSKLHAKMAEAMTIRALCYFYLVRSFKEVPLVLTPSLSDLQNYKVSQSSEDVVLDKLEADLTQAEEWALTTYPTLVQTKCRITKNAVRALLADIYLWRGKYSQCISKCNTILADPSYKLINTNLGFYTFTDPAVQTFVLCNSTESVFELGFNQTIYGSQREQGSNAGVAAFYGSETYKDVNFLVPDNLTGTTSDKNSVFIITSSTTAKTKTPDLRRATSISSLGMQQTYYVAKYVTPYTILTSSSSVNDYTDYMNSIRNMSSSVSNWIFYRITDIMLMKAEAVIEQARTTSTGGVIGTADVYDAVKMVNTTYLRSNPSITDSIKPKSNTIDAWEDYVLEERQRELLFEGKRWYDLLRKARRDGNTKWLVEKVIRKYVSNAGVIRAKMTDLNSMYWPINEDELKANGNLNQNPFYVSTSSSK